MATGLFDEQRSELIPASWTRLGKHIHCGLPRMIPTSWTRLGRHVAGPQGDEEFWFASQWNGPQTCNPRYLTLARKMCANMTHLCWHVRSKLPDHCRPTLPQSAKSLCCSLLACPELAPHPHGRQEGCGEPMQHQEQLQSLDIREGQRDPRDPHRLMVPATDSDNRLTAIRAADIEAPNPRCSVSASTPYPSLGMIKSYLALMWLRQTHTQINKVVGQIPRRACAKARPRVRRPPYLVPRPEGRTADAGRRGCGVDWGSSAHSQGARGDKFHVTSQRPISHDDIRLIEVGRRPLIPTRGAQHEDKRSCATPATSKSLFSHAARVFLPPGRQVCA